VELGAYKCHVFLDFREVQDNEWHQYAHLAAYLNGRGVPSIEEALRETLLQPIHYAFKELVNPGMFSRLMAARVTQPGQQLDAGLMDEVEGKTAHLLREAKGFSGAAGDEMVIAREVRHKVEAALQLPTLGDRFPPPKRLRGYREALKYLQTNLGDDPAVWGSLLGWLFVHSLGKVLHETDFEAQSRSWIDEWLLGKIIAGALRDLGLDEAAAWWRVALVKLLTTHQRWFESQVPGEKQAYRVLVSWLQDSEVQQFLQVNRYQDALWFNKETFEQLLGWMALLATVQISADPQRPASQVPHEIAACYAIVQQLLRAGQQSEYQIEKLLAVLEE
jgi:hypothetical protein